LCDYQSVLIEFHIKNLQRKIIENAILIEGNWNILLVLVTEIVINC